ncbi:hypothetical protein SmJEL517_g01700 [Synchytrium microbalum]|uniref:BAH domain-containing protein n=1 Tax=Synchytrium microbalum TaxID=1806994 RepID=A0A507CED7_9FUNG|nr:uncharacterized protein SmJEL517_g01700 [Synchytrium microbalum]TPX35945.1 hypothetical protein SmJEL517_g01700 [Synchytrium microbalum]
MKLKLTLHQQQPGANSPAPNPSNNSIRTLTDEQKREIMNKVARTARDAREPETGRHYAFHFIQIPDPNEYPEYYQLFRDVVAFDTMQNKINTNQYASLDDFTRDFNIMIANAQQFNKTKSPVWKDAATLKEIFEATLRSELEAYGISHTPIEPTPQPSQSLPAVKAEVKAEVRTEARSIKTPMCLNMISKRLNGKGYDTQEQFETDMKIMFKNAQRYNKEGSEIYEDAVELERLFQTLVARDLSSSAPITLTPAMVVTPEGDSVEEVKFNGETWKVGEWCHIRNPLDPSRPTIGQIWEIIKSSKPDGPSYIKAMWYLRPEQTVQLPGAKFYENEVFKTNTTLYYKLEEIESRCFVLWWRQYHKGRPRGLPKSCTVYACESRYTDQKRQEKIKNWQQCLPRKNKIEIDNFPEPKSQRKYFAEFAREDAHTQTPPISRRRAPSAEPPEPSEYLSLRRRSRSPGAERDGGRNRMGIPSRLQSGPPPRQQAPARPVPAMPAGQLHPPPPGAYIPPQLQNHVGPLQTATQYMVDNRDGISSKTASYFDATIDGRLKWFTAPPLDVLPTAVASEEPLVHSLEYLVFKRKRLEDEMMDAEQQQHQQPNSKKGRVGGIPVVATENVEPNAMTEPISALLKSMAEAYEYEAASFFQ